MALVMMGSLALIELILTVLFIVVLVKQFRRDGALKGILGIISCGIYTFIWGWINTRNCG
ncbi:MAG: hypothetical protein JSW39_08845 [Desulfobacterales bacterium]|nr:MAG: hypothetical protein JSW39_08845 [Desulfobacterales bacterium]